MHEPHAATSRILSLLQEGDKYGYEIAAALAGQSNNPFHLNEGLLYPLLHTLEQTHLVKTYAKTAPTGRTRKYYRITRSGLRYLSKTRQTGGRA